MKRIAHACVAASVLLWSSTLAALDVKSSNCGEDCTVTITVSGAGCGAGVSIRPDPLIFLGRGEKRIEWVVSPPWEFAKNGIVINLGGGEFDPPSFDPKKIKIKNRNTKAGTYKYDINLVNGKLTCNIDPTIVNY